MRKLRTRLTVIPANAEALHNSEAGQSSRNNPCEALKNGFVLRTPCLNWIPAFAGMTVGQDQIASVRRNKN
jgi:hypothetical protein